ncbi:MAG: hypothetical protein NWE78_01710 [Candidatus Bathyarchaeota archaeon]|jgi:predicted transcriptional regulator|nr:hypothetical protein [Candidatus Bathyarchaeota archaeon]
MTVVKYVLPAFRALVMKDLIEEYKMRKIDVSSKMGVTPAAITQYIKGDRGVTFKERVAESEETMKILSELAEALAHDNVSEEIIETKLCKACMTIRTEETHEKK